MQNAEINWISHRGVIENATENTRKAFQDAVAAGFQTLETDLQATADGVLVLSHDSDTSHVSSTSIDITESQYKEIKRIKTFDGQEILRFADFASEFSQVKWLLDIKPESSNGVVDALRIWVKENDKDGFLFRNARFLCWDRKEQEYARRKLPGAIFMARPAECKWAGFFCLLRMPWFGRIEKGKSYGLYPTAKAINLFKPGIIDGYHRYGADVLAYRPKDETQIELALSAGVDEVLLDFPSEKMRQPV